MATMAIVVPKRRNETAAEKSVRYAIEAEKICADMYRRAKKAVVKGQDVELGTVRICPVCGWTVEGDAAPHCLIYGAEQADFKKF